MNIVKSKKKDIKPTDSDLVRLLNKNCEKSFKILFDRYVEPVTKYSYHLCNNADMARDIAQDVFVKIWEKRETLDPEKSLKFFLFVLARNTIISNFRKLNSFKKYKEHFQYTNSKEDQSLENQIHSNELSSILTQAIDSLPTKRKIVFQLSRNERLTYQEISEKLNISPRTVEVHIALALKNIREYLQNQYGGIITMAIAILCFTSTIM